MDLALRLSTPVIIVELLVCAPFVRTGQPQAIGYVPGAVPEGDGLGGLRQLG